MSKEEIMMKILTATPETIGRVAAILDGRPTGTTPGDRKLLTLMDAAREIGCSRMTVHRMCADGRLATVQMRAGRRRIPSAAITAFVTTGKGA